MEAFKTTLAVRRQIHNVALLKFSGEICRGLERTG